MRTIAARLSLGQRLEPDLAEHPFGEHFGEGPCRQRGVEPAERGELAADEGAFDALRYRSGHYLSSMITLLLHLLRLLPLPLRRPPPARPRESGVHRQNRIRRPSG